MTCAHASHIPDVAPEARMSREIIQMEHEMCSYLEQLNVDPKTLRNFEMQSALTLASPAQMRARRP
ncbi:hypothetical protein EWM64_g9590 [Hericium alpestre]|uniref:Uncharacterized protein n=1 Tax=Hericium alpestre TaxID=135208 RepID=A0A4Y9ZID8_9AGAM|nr:hypothetical protein EWM64_g9590 [Hericium alpestre]